MEGCGVFCPSEDHEQRADVPARAQSAVRGGDARRRALIRGIEQARALILDACALAAYLRDEAAAEEVARLLRSPTLMSTVNVAEVMDQLVRVDGHDRDEVEIRLATLQVAGMTLHPVDDELGIAAGVLLAKYYHRSACNVSLPDCFAAATGLALDLPIATADPHLGELVRAEGGRVHVLP